MNVWGYIALLVIGFAIGLFVGAKYVQAGTEYSVRKVKVKGDSNELSATIPTVAEVKKQRKGLIRRIKDKRNERHNKQ